jgi:hypothetical protein
MANAHRVSHGGGAVTPEQTEVLAKLREIESQAGLLLEDFPNLQSLQRIRINHIVGLAGYLRTMIGHQLTLVKKQTG